MWFLRRVSRRRPIILITNDDGVEAPGLRALERPLAGWGEVWTVAPSHERSTSSHSMTLVAPVRVTELGPRRFGVGGTPVDAIFLALFSLLPRRPALVVSGINRGPNLGTDVIYSGTVAAAREAAMRGIPAAAISLVEGSAWSRAARIAARIAAPMLAAGRRAHTPDGRGLLVNVNVPGRARGRIRLTRLGARRYPENVERHRIRPGLVYAWLGLGPLHGDRAPGTDTATVAGGDVSVTVLAIDQTLDDGPERFRRLMERAEP